MMEPKGGIILYTSDLYKSNLEINLLDISNLENFDKKEK